MRNLHSRDNSYVSRILMGERIRYSYIIGIWKFYFLEFFAIYSSECCKPDRFSEGTRFDTLRRIELKRKKKEKILSFTRTQLWLDAEKAGHVLSVF